jgi:rhodanese-related sulfurtransferase
MMRRLVSRIAVCWLLLLAVGSQGGDGAARTVVARQQGGQINNVELQQVEALRHEKKAVILDVRTPSEYVIGHIPGAVNIDWQAKDFLEKVAALDKAQSYLVHCAAGARSARACDTMVRLNFSNLYNLKDGFKAWEEAGMPVEKGLFKLKKSVATESNTH